MKKRNLIITVLVLTLTFLLIPEMSTMATAAASKSDSTHYHTFGEWEVITEETDHSAGTRQRTCQTCGQTQTETVYPEGTLRLYDVGREVKDLQWALYRLGYLSASQIDGGYGTRTEEAVKRFQEKNGLTADGIAWPQTLDLIF